MNQQAQQREVDLVKIVAPLLETSRPLLDASTRQYIRQAKSLADLFVLASGDAFVFLAQTGSVSRLCVALALSERSSGARRRSMEAEIAGTGNLCIQLKTTHVESATWQASALNTTEVMDFLKKFNITLETRAANLST